MEGAKLPVLFGKFSSQSIKTADATLTLGRFSFQFGQIAHMKCRNIMNGQNCGCKALKCVLEAKIVAHILKITLVHFKAICVRTIYMETKQTPKKTQNKCFSLVV